jgi:hypothetical protein
MRLSDRVFLATLTVWAVSWIRYDLSSPEIRFILSILLGIMVGWEVGKKYEQR